MSSPLQSRPVLVCTGFHRSATSAVAHYLHRGGLNMGHHLMGADISNPAGHFEDWPVVKLHDAALASSQSSWHYCDETRLSMLPPQALNNYISARDQEDKVWGFKDPRAMLYLDSWEAALGERGRYVFIVRHWAECIESLLQRQSRHIAYKEVSIDNYRLHSAFWLQPDLAAKMWLAYNTRLLHFIGTNKSKCLVLTHKAVQQGHPLLRSMNEKFDLGLDETALSPVNPKWVSGRVSENVCNSLSGCFRSELDIVWEKLMNCADFQSSEEDVAFYTPNTVDLSLIARLADALPESVGDAEDSSKPDCADLVIRLAEVNSEAGLAELLKWAIPIKADASVCKQLRDHVDTNYLLSQESYRILANYFFSADQFHWALDSYRQGLSLARPRPQFYASIGRCYEKLNDVVRANYFYDQAIRFNPANAMFYCHKASLLNDIGQSEEAVGYFRQALQHAPLNKRVITRVAIAFEQAGKLDEALAALAPILEQEDRGVKRLYVKLLLAKDFEQGSREYFSMVSTDLQENDRLDLLARILSETSSAAAERDLLCRVERHWHVLAGD